MMRRCGTSRREAAASLFVVLLSALLVAPAAAGPLRDRIEARRAQAAGQGQGTAADPLAEAQATGDEAAASEAGPPGVRLLRDQSYGEHPRQRFDVYLPASPNAAALKDAPVLLLVHGGGWAHGDKAARSVVENKVARWVPRGFIVVSANYRLLPDAQPVAQANDIARALATVQRQAPGWGGDARQLVLMGHSAGAHLVSLLASAPEIAGAAGAAPWRATVALDSAGFDVEKIMRARHYRLYDPAFGDDPVYWREASPLQRLRAPGVPFLAVCSTRRPDQPCAQAHAFADKARRLGMAVEVLEQPLSHRDINQMLGQANAYTDAVEGFLRRLDPAFAQRLP